MRASVLVLVALTGVARADCTHSCSDALTACKRTRCAGLHRSERRRCLADCRGSAGCAGPIGTLAYVVSSCRQLGATQVGSQELRVQRGSCDPVTVMRFESPEPIGDPIGLCTFASKNRAGYASPVAGVFQRLDVSPDGTTVVFEVTNQFQLLFPPVDLAPEQQGFFVVRADGTGLRRLGPPSRDSVFRILVAPSGSPSGANRAFPDFQKKLAISEDGTRIAYTDRGPGPTGQEDVQVVTLDVATGERRQVSHFDPIPRPPEEPHELFWPAFVDADTVLFERPLAGDGWEVWTVGFDGSNLRDVTPTIGPVPGDGLISARLHISGRRFDVFRRGVGGPTDNVDVFPDQRAVDIFRETDGTKIQLTNFHRWDTWVLEARQSGLLFMGSADRLGTNPYQNCQLFRVSLLGTNLRQVTQFGTGERSMKGCRNLTEAPGCSIDLVTTHWYTVASPRVLFYSDCDPFGTNPNGGQVFAVDHDGGRLRQITHTAGARVGTDGVLEVDIPGPAASGGR